MNQHLHSPTKLTEFARDFEDEPETLFGRFVNKIQNAYNASYNSVNDIPAGGGNSATSFPKSVPQSTFYADASASNITRDSSSSSIESIKPQPPTSLQVNPTTDTSSSTTTEDLSESAEKVDQVPVEATEGRTMVNVLKRISNIVATKNSDLRNYKDTDLQRFWMPDAKAKECYDCSQKFSTFRRKHHCRLCGQIFCSKCCDQVVPGKIIMCSGALKVCNYCSKIVLSYLKSPNITVDLHSDLHALQQDLSSKLSQRDNDLTTSYNNAQPLVARKVSVGYQEERFATNQPNSLSNADRKNILQQSNSLITLHEEMQRQLPSQNSGTDLIDFLNTNHKSSNKVQAMAILSAMLAAGFLTPLVPDAAQQDFDENLHYKFAERRQDATLNFSAGLPDVLEGDVHIQCESSSPQFESVTSGGAVDLQLPKSLDVSQSFQSVQDIEVENSIRSTTTTSKLLESYCDHEDQLLIQMLRNFHLDQRWAKVLSPLCCRAGNHFKPEYLTNELMDIRNYVNFKKVPGGRRQECTIVGGVVFSKNVAHKDMATRVERPRILLLQCPIVYERVEGKFVSISTVMLQEKEYLRNVTARIMSFKPNVVLVHKNVAGIAQDMLRSQGITLVLDVKLTVMERLARSLQCDILTSIESNITQPKLGNCDAFYIGSYSDGYGSTKTLMFFEKLSSPRGYTCLLRGGNNTELAKVKKVASFLVYARYNWRLEMSFLLDEFARPLSPKPPIFDSKEQSPEDGNPDDNTAKCLTTVEDQPQIPSVTKVRKIIERKSEEKIVTAVIENVSDFTDPLRSAELSMGTLSTTMSPMVELAVETPYDNRFRTALSSTVLSVSPFLSFPLPYLETEQGRKCSLRPLFPKELYFSKQWSSPSSIHCISGGCNNNNDHLEKPLSDTSNNNDEKSLVQMNPAHAFLRHKITAPIDSRELQTLLAEFRAFGGRYPKRKKMLRLIKRRESYQRPQKIRDDQLFKDALDLENHQRLAVLFCSFYFNPKAASSFCAPPTLLDMKFYGQQDIMLGQFLLRYCFRISYICTLCDLPMMDHVRRYVHSMGCVQVFLNEDSSKNDPNRIYFTSWCSICNEVTPSVPISETTKCLSFAKYLEMRFHGHAYKKRLLEDVTPKDISPSQNCQHSLHRDYIHYFTYRGIGAKFMYTPIEVWEIGMPPLILYLKLPKPFHQFQVLEDIKDFSMKGHEVYSKIHERIADVTIEDETPPILVCFKATLSKDQFIFKQHVEIVQTLLTEKNATPYDLSDAMLMAKRTLAESIELWIPRLHEMAVMQKLLNKQDSSQHHIDSGTICTEDGIDASVTTAEAKVTIDSSQLEESSETEQCSPPLPAEKVSIRNTLDYSASVMQSSTSTDKKSIKKMLSHLLPSSAHANLLQSPLSQQEHYTLPLGVFPILVRDNDLSSIIAYSLGSNDYRNMVESLGSICVSGSTNVQITTDAPASSPKSKRKSQDGSLDSDGINKETNSKPSTTASATTSTETDEVTKKSKSTSHIEVSFQDQLAQFTCKIYFAKEFDLLRAKGLKPPKIGKSLYKEHEQNKKREEFKISPGKGGSNCPEFEIVRRPSDGDCSTTTTTATTADCSPSGKEENTQLQSEIEESRTFFARSLCRSLQWEARGGKSGSKFSKTSDERFVLKEMTKSDIAIFENFAPNYFEYIGKCLQHEQPTLLAKIFGVFKVTIRKKDSFQEKSLLVMENLFYGCDIQNKFDLKGSERNRLVDPTNRNGEIVLLDENLVQMSWSKPLYILSHSKTILKDAINRDSSFLEKNEVMDYSLLVGLNSKDSVLVVGIIDYIRTFTFEKKVESFVKQTGLLGGMGKLPTVISPERYKQRFTDAMDRYFYMVPDRWEGLSKI